MAGGGVGSLLGLVSWVAPRLESYSNGASVSNLKDYSNNGNSFVQATGANQPVFQTASIGTQASVKYDGTNDFFSCNQLTMGKSITGFTIYAVFKKSSITGDQSVLHLENNISGTRIAINLNNSVGNSTVGGRVGEVSTFVSVAAPSADLLPHIMCGTLDYTTGEIKIYLDGILITQDINPALVGASTPATNSTGITMGNRLSANYTSANIGDVIFCNKPHNNTTQSYIYGLLKGIYGI
jgi:hypothetical protein